MKDMAAVAAEVELNAAASQNDHLSVGHVHSGNDHHDIAAHEGEVQMDGGTHQFGNVDLALEVGFSREMCSGRMPRTMS